MNIKGEYEWLEFYGDPSWFIRDRFGLFIHFGLFTMAARHEWVQTLEKISADDYQKYFDNFNPDLLDMKDWAKKAKKAGFKYAVLTTKHHEGFSLWDTKVSEYKVTNTPYQKDLVKEFTEAFREEGLKIGFYFSLLDWKHEDFLVDGYHPERENEVYIKDHPGNMDRYAEFMRAQVRELLTDYGKIDYIWFDFSYANRDWGNSVGKGRDDWQSEKLEKMILDLQPEIIINDRLDLGRGVATPEQYQRNSAMDTGKKKLIWEACQTMNNSWGYDRDNLDWKTPEMILRLLIDTVSKGGNLLLNVGPNGRGEWGRRTDEVIEKISEWMRLNERSITGCGQSEFVAPQDCRFTQNGKHLYLHLFSWPYRTLVIQGLGGKVEYAQLVNDNSEIKFIEDEGLSTKRKSHKDLNKEVTEIHIKESFFDNTLMLVLPVQKPDTEIPVIEFILKEA